MVYPDPDSKTESGSSLHACVYKNMLPTVSPLARGIAFWTAIPVGLELSLLSGFAGSFHRDCTGICLLKSSRIQSRT